MDSDISSFEVIHSGLVKKLLLYLTVSEAGSSFFGNIERDDRLRAFLHIFMGTPVSIKVIFLVFGSFYMRVGNAHLK